GCAEERRAYEKGTWITEAMVNAYIELHKAGYAHSVESWIGGELAGGLYGISIGKAFFGESMFYRESGASKAAFVGLVQRLTEWDFSLIDCQMPTQHLINLGAKEIPRREFLELLREAVKFPTKKGRWG
ncbi:MAG: leucyl/phenylalanyl-tRNA--protein transferase, partial [Nitrospirae bacterium]|nr:leucyl/phenylalanyl-tRNA--protein transferase [Nitrospirota bacterium]